jgi:hypothetical protein
VLAFDPAVWREFVAEAKAGSFDLHH